jgi:1-acyl-sn-glycerol-3-phosphate acyltransferase
LLTLLFRYWVRPFRATGANNVPPAGGAFLIANHTSAMDPFILAYPVRRRMPWGPAKIELFKNSILGYLMRKIGMFPIRQGSADAGAVRTMVELYRGGRIVIVYPEGGRSKSGELQPFFPEFARLVIKLKAPIVPAAIAGGPELLPIGSRMPRRGTPVVVKYGEAFELKDFYDTDLNPEILRKASERMRTRVLALLEGAREERDALCRDAR